jgi:GDP-L-fucose synthase
MHSDKILITGASGVIGQALKKELEASGYADVIALSSAKGDLRSEEQTLKIFKDVKPDIVYHLAARVYGIMGNMQNKGKAYIDNTRINTNVIDAAFQAGARKVVAMGSSAIYSDSVTLPMTENQIWNGAPHFSEAAYAHSKRGMLAQLEAYHAQYGLDFSFCISTNLYGPHDKFDEQWGHVLPSLISKFHRACRDGDDVSVWGTGKARRDFLFGADAAYAMRLIGESFTGPINLATGKSQTIRETVEMISKISGFRGNVSWDASKPDGQNLRQYDVTKLEALGFVPRHSLEEGLTKTYQWYSENVDTART